jgi:agmatine deiminase
VKRRGFIAALTGAATMAKAGFANPDTGLPAGYFVPSEDAPHTRTFMQWPNNRKVYRDSTFLNMTQRTIADIANTIVQFEPVIMLAQKSEHAHIRKLISGDVDLWDIPTEDLWCRDSGPLFAVHPTKGLGISNLNFNGWGRKQVHVRDAKIAALVAQRLDLPLFDSGLHGEAGGVEQDGYGTLIAHESSWVIDNRNPIPKQQVEQRLLYAYGAAKVIWAKGLKGQDITDYHIDSLARFVAENHILIQLPDDPDVTEPWTKAALQTYKLLKKSTDAKGRPLKITVVPEPILPRIKSYDFVAAYANFYVCNGAIIAAEYGDIDTDRRAKDILKSIYPNHEVITMNVDPLGELGGGIHCATQQQPAI